MQNTRDQALVHDYARDLGDYGGMFHDSDVLVVLFTAKLAEHERAIRALVAEPAMVTVLPAARAWGEVLAATDRVRAQLAGRPDVCSVGVTVAASAFVVTVGLDPYSSLAADAVRAATAPEPVLVRSQGPIVTQPMRTAADRVTI